MPAGLFVLEEGPDDARFVERVLCPLLHPRYQWVKLYQFANKKHFQVCKFVSAMPKLDADYILLKDLDDSPCVAHRKDLVRVALGVTDPSKVHIVVAEIGRGIWPGSMRSI